MNRRSFLTLTAAAGTSIALAGCTALFTPSRPDELEDVEADADQLPIPTIGSADVTIDVYEDLACPTCRNFQADVFPELEERVLDPGEATYRHFDFPLPADEIGLDQDIVGDALTEGTYYPTLAADWDHADSNDVDRTPTVLVDGETVDDPLDADEIVSMVDDGA